MNDADNSRSSRAVTDGADAPVAVIKSLPDHLRYRE